MTGASSLQMERPTMPPSTKPKPAFDQHRAGLQGQHAADKKREDAHHQQAAVADLKELIEDLAALAPGQRQRPQRPPEQHYDFADILKHITTGPRPRRAVLFSKRNVAHAPVCAFAA